MAGVYNLTIECGANFYRRISWLNSSGTPIDTTGYTAKMQIRRQPDDTVLIDLTTENGKLTVSDNGVIDINIPPSDTTPIQFSKAVYDLFLKSPTDYSYKLIKGQITFEHEVTKYE